MQASRRRGAVAVLFAVLATVLAIPTPVGGQVAPTCNGLEATIIGTDGRDNLRGTPGDDVIVGLGGPDRIVGLGGNDTICGGTGRDFIRGNNGRDTIFGEGGRDRIHGGGGRDAIHGMGGNDLLLGGNGDDHIDGGIGDDRADAADGADTCKDTPFVKNCEELIGLVSVVTGFDGRRGWSASWETASLGLAFSDDGRFAVFTGRPIDNARLLEVVVRDMVSGEFTVVGRSRRLKFPYLGGIDISGDGSTVAFSSNADGLVDGPDTAGLRLYLVDLTEGSIELMPIPDEVDLNGAYRPELSTDGSVIVYELVNNRIAQRLSDAVSIIRQTSDGEIDVLNEAADGSLFEGRGSLISGDGSTVAFSAENHELPNEKNGIYSDPVVWTDGSAFIAYPDLIHRRTSAYPQGLSADGSTLVGSLGRPDDFYMNRAVFFDVETGTSSTVRADSFCENCWFNGLAYEGSWVAANLLWDVDDAPSQGRGIALFTEDGRRDVVLAGLDMWHAGISPDGRTVGVFPFTSDPYLLLYRDLSN